MKIKSIAWLLLLAMTIVSLASCGGNENTPAGTEGTTDAKTEASDTVSSSDKETDGETTEESTEEVTTVPETEAIPDYLVLYVDSDVKLIDDASTNETGGGSGNPIQFVEGSGVGYSSLNDIVYFENVDFGEKGAKSMTIQFSNGNRQGAHTTLAVYIDSYENSEPVCVFDIKYTGGWDIGYAKPFTVDCTIPAGTHTVYIQYTNENSGSFAELSFGEAA